MGFPIPKIEYKNAAIIGDTTNGSPTIANVDDIADVEAGMKISGTGIPTGAYVLTVGATSITISANATVTNTSVALEVHFVVTFEYPPKEPMGEARSTKATTSTSLSGIQQTSVQYIEATRKLVFSFVNPTIFALLETFMDDHALIGSAFRYFDDQTLTNYVEYELAKLEFDPKKIASRSTTTYSWEVPLNIRRVL